MAGLNVAYPDHKSKHWIYFGSTLPHLTERGDQPARDNRLRKLIALLFLPCAALANESGQLVLIGGALRSDNAAVYQEFIKAVGETGRIAVFTTASGAPVEAGTRIQRTLEDFGVVKERIVLVRLAVTDDRSTPLFDEREWSENAFDPDEVARLGKVKGVWFGEGDQRRLTETLLDDGRATPMLRMIQSRHKSGAVVGGSSAGAAIMSDPMIVGGESLPSLLRTSALGEQLELETGLGFFPNGLVDLHFDARARLGRLALALQNLDPDRRLGFGVDENTALIVDGSTMRVVGDGQVTLVDGREASWQQDVAGFSISGLKVSIFSPGDRFYFDREVTNPASYMRPTRGTEYFQSEPQSGGGIAMPGGSLSQLLGRDLIDNGGADTISALSFAMRDRENGRGLRYIFSQTDKTRGYWGRDGRGIQRYSILNLDFAIEPLSVTVR